MVTFDKFRWAGVFEINPSDDVLSSYELKQKEELEYKELLKNFIGKDILNKYKNEDILDIKYTGIRNSTYSNIEEYSVMIIFK